MPLQEGEAHAPKLALPALGGDSPLWVVRFTGEVFDDYE
jgi:hypothetical protein